MNGIMQKNLDQWMEIEWLEIAIRRHIIIPVKGFFKRLLPIPKKILIIRFGAIGDVVHTTNVYRSIKASYPNSKIHYLTSKVPSELLINDKDLDRVWVIDPKKIKFNSGYVKEYAKNLRAEKFDCVINLQPSFKSKYLISKIGVKRRLNYKKKNEIHAVTNFWKTAYNAIPNLNELQNTQIFLDENICTKVKKEIESYPRPYIILNVGGMHSPRQGRVYPVEKWVELGNKLQDKFNGTIFITGLDEDKNELKELEQIKNSVSFVGKMSLLETASLTKQVDLMVSGDSGPLHIAMALGVKTIGLYGSMPPARSGCYGYTGSCIVSDYHCAPCNKRKCKYLKKTKELYAPCMKAIDVEKVLGAINIREYICPQK